MNKFSLVLSRHVSSTTKISVYELRKNGRNLFQHFVDEIEKDGNLFDKLAGAIRIVEETSNLKRFPKKNLGKLKAIVLIVKLMKQNQVL